jgi:hypothetical protein
MPGERCLASARNDNKEPHLSEGCGYYLAYFGFLIPQIIHARVFSKEGARHRKV